ncbi:MAG: Asp-tRNA(Asn)/Glu-tRNA(Gln) amidotransferase subunit GatB [Eubacterium sp.]|nr:Asp-tRNA(Asn)/Glu-tRNA(Gln) amidotransferase subunit GatB [Eubacterium sp.]
MRNDCVNRSASPVKIGLEIHVELATETKIFCGCSTAFGAPVNTQVCPVCLGLPGTLPVLNRRVTEYAIAIGLVLDCDIRRTFRFDRKNYFYPDNPQNYQISQLYTPIGTNGKLEIRTEQGIKPIRIHEIHMEEDAGKLIHSERGDTLVDYNRAGVPLVEIVTEPDMESAEEVIAFLEMLRRRIRYTGVSDCRMNEGSMRVDVNLSVRETGYGIRTEMKNLNSFKAIARAIGAERERQAGVVKSGKTVVQETRRWDDDRGESFSMRSKEDAKDYRYFPDPDLPEMTVEEAWIDEIRSRLPEMPEAKAERYRETYGLPEYDIGILIDEPALADLFETTTALGVDPKKVSNWLMGETMRLLKERDMEPEDLRIDPRSLADLIDMTDRGTINSTTAKDVFEVIFDHTIDVKKYVEDHGLSMVSDFSELEEIITEIITVNPGPVADYHAGKKKAAGFLVGQVMKKTGGKANPAMVRELLEQKLENG